MNLEQPAVKSNVFVVTDYLQAPIENWTFYSLFYVEDILSFVTFAWLYSGLVVLRRYATLIIFVCMYVCMYVTMYVLNFGQEGVCGGVKLFGSTLLQPARCWRLLQVLFSLFEVFTRLHFYLLLHY